MVACLCCRDNSDDKNDESVSAPGTERQNFNKPLESPDRNREKEPAPTEANTPFSMNGARRDNVGTTAVLITDLTKNNKPSDPVDTGDIVLQFNENKNAPASGLAADTNPIADAAGRTNLGLYTGANENGAAHNLYNSPSIVQSARQGQVPQKPDGNGPN